MGVLKFRGKPLRVLDFDTEVRPLSYLGSDYTTGEVTAIAWAWVVDGKAVDLQCATLTKRRDSGAQMLKRFVNTYNAADMVTGHFIRGYDLPVLNGACLDAGLPPLQDKLTHDTKNDLRKRKYVSASQENLGAHLMLEHPKVQMNQHKWREANRLTPEGIALTRERVIGDVVQHVELREELLRLGWLDSPKVWRSAGALTGAYVP